MDQTALTHAGLPRDSVQGYGKDAVPDGHLNGTVQNLLPAGGHRILTPGSLHGCAHASLIPHHNEIPSYQFWSTIIRMEIEILLLSRNLCRLVPRKPGWFNPALQRGEGGDHLECNEHRLCRMIGLYDMGSDKRADRLDGLLPNLNDRLIDPELLVIISLVRPAMSHIMPA
ncbi:MAG: hypothetical protein ACXU95_17140 [Isosphaeraceae bacterium]